MHLIKETYFSFRFMTGFIYNIISILSQGLIWPAQWLSPKMAAFVRGRQNSFDQLTQTLTQPGKRIWMHCASLGEFEQGRPILEWFRKKHPGTTLVVTFFSPSGYTVRKDTDLADVVVYLPWDTRYNAKRFLDLVQPTSAFFVKSELWPNYIEALKKQHVPIYLIAAQFRPNQLFFKPYGGFFKRLLQAMTHIFVQNQSALELVKSMGIQHVSLSGDTRFDRVMQQSKGDNTLPFLEVFKKQARCVILGSSWPEDHDLWLGIINEYACDQLKFVIAPHSLASKEMDRISGQIIPTTLRYNGSESTDQLALSHAQVLILNTMGDLAKAYAYADLAYVGGALGTTGLHNILEPATFGLPIVIGPHIKKFPEAIALKDLGGLYVVHNESDLRAIIAPWIDDANTVQTTGNTALNFVQGHIGATQHIVDYLSGHR